MISNKMAGKSRTIGGNPAHKEGWHHKHKEIVDTSYPFSVLYKENSTGSEHVGKVFIEGRRILVVGDSQAMII